MANDETVNEDTTNTLNEDAATATVASSTTPLRYIENEVKQTTYINEMYTKYHRGANPREIYNNANEVIKGLSIATAIILAFIIILLLCLFVYLLFNFTGMQWLRFLGSVILIILIIFISKKLELI